MTLRVTPAVAVSSERRVLAVASARDVEACRVALAENGDGLFPCADLSCLLAELGNGAECLLLTDDVAGGEDTHPAYLQLDHLADELPPTEHAAVLLRYGYDLDYAEIGAALGSSEDAARQAASSGIRRLRRKEGHA
jgi:DNA-directed RNA polymerase specialized sigma24 family protein